LTLLAGRWKSDELSLGSKSRLLPKCFGERLLSAATDISTLQRREPSPA
jgi:hypothetical protein